VVGIISILLCKRWCSVGWTPGVGGKVPGGSHRRALSLYIEVGVLACHILVWGSMRVVRNKHGVLYESV